MSIYKKLLVAVGYTGEAEFVTRRAKSLCASLGADFLLLHVVERMQLMGGPESFAYVELFAEEKEARQRAEADLLSLQQKLDLQDTQWILRTGVVRDEVLDVAQIELADLVVVGTHSRGYMGALLGSTANSILHCAKTDVLAVRIPRRLEGVQHQSLYKRILVAVDFTPDIEPVIRRAKAFASAFGAELILVHVINRAPVLEMPLSLFEKEILERVNWQFSQLLQTHALTGVRTEVLVGSPSHEVAGFAEREHVDLAITGSHARHGFGLLLGSMANGVFHHVRCDALAVRVGN